jgi:hypothetical protein
MFVRKFRDSPPPLGGELGFIVPGRLDACLLLFVAIAARALQLVA